MDGTHSPMSLHLKYRLGIAEMNRDIDILRIFDDYLTELRSQKNNTEISAGIDHFEKEFVRLRKEIDDLRHQMHLHKMNLAALSREGKMLDDETYKSEDHDGLAKRYFELRKRFDKVREEFATFESKWLK